MSHWPERDDELKRLIEEKLTAREIAGRMWISKNSVCGRAHRMGWSIKGQMKGPRTPAGIERARKPRPPRPALTQVGIRHHLLSIPYGNVSLMELSDCQCHFIEGDISNGYCGRPADILTPYCEEHRKRMFQPARR